MPPGQHETPLASAQNSIESLIQLIHESGLFDANFYAKQSGIQNTTESLIKHYVESGAGSGLDPNQFFHSTYYLEHNLDDSNRNDNPLVHYIKGGRHQLLRTSAIFDPRFYLERYPDVREGGAEPLRHYLQHGGREQRLPCQDLEGLFDFEYYKNQLNENADGVDDLLLHYLIVGAQSGLNPNQFFDSQFYVETYPDVADRQLNPLAHYIEEGAAAGNRTHPLFDTSYYAQTYADLAGYPFNLLHHYLRSGMRENRRPSANFDPKFYTRMYADVKESKMPAIQHYLQTGLNENRRGAAGVPVGFPRDVYLSMRKIEPLLPQTLLLHQISERVVPNHSPVGTAYLKLADCVEQPFSHLFVLPWLQRGGADLVAINYIKLVVEKFGSTAPLVILTTDKANEGLHLLPEGVRYIQLSELHPELSVADRIWLLIRFIMQAEPRVVHNINSSECWYVFKTYYRQIPEKTKLVACLFADSLDQDMRLAGNPTENLNASIDHLSLLLTDTRYFIEDLKLRFALEDAIGKKMIPVGTPSREERTDLPPPPVTESSRKTVLWASRLAPEKRADILARIAEALPDHTFKVWGTDFVSKIDMNILSRLPNIQLLGAYEQFRSIVEKSGSYTFLYTSESDGLPLVLLEAVSCGLAVVAPNVGGISELISNETGWLIESCTDVDTYVKSLLEALNDDSERTRRVKQAQQLVIDKYSKQSFKSTVTATGYLDY